jgi:hypothetical protein
MRKTALILAAGAAMIVGPALQAGPRLTGEARLAKLLEGREAGPPVDCISLYANRDSRIIDDTAIVYGSGRTIYVNRPSNPDSLDSDDVMVVRLHSSQLCRLDTVHMHDRSGHFFTGFVGLEQFVPYRRVAHAN